MANAPELSVVVPTFRRPRALDALLSSLAVQVDPPPFDVVVADDGSGDETPEVVDRWRGAGLPARALPLDHRGPAAARNAALRAAEGRLVLFLDDDEVADPGLLAAHGAAHRAHPGDQEAVLGQVAWPPGVRPTRFRRWLDASGLQFAYSYLRPGPVRPAHAAFVTANVSLKRAFLVDGGTFFDERFPYAAFEDSDLGWRLAQRGLELHYHPEALSVHARPFHLTAFAQRMERVGESFAILRRANPEYPLDEAFFTRGPDGSRARLLRLASPLLRAAGPDRYAFRYYDDVVTRAFRRGLARSPAAARIAG